MGTTENETNKYYSEFFGSKTVKKNSLQLSSADLTKDIAGSTNAEKATLILPDELMRLKQGEIVLKVFRHQPCRTFLLPIFDNELQHNKTFHIGAVRFDWVNKRIDKNKLFYDLNERDNKYDNIDEELPPEDLEEEEPDEMKNGSETPMPPATTASDDLVMNYLKKVARSD